MSSDKKFLSAADILTIEDRPVEDVWVEQWQGHVRMQGLTGDQRDRFESSIVVMKGGRVRDVRTLGLRARLVALSAINEKGGQLFTDAEAAALGSKSAAALETLFEAAQRLSGLSNQDVEELEENLEPTRNGHSGTG